MQSPPQTQQFTAVITREEDDYVALCPELDIASEGESIEAAKQNLAEAIALFFKVATPVEVKKRLRSQVLITTVDVTVPHLTP